MDLQGIDVPAEFDGPDMLAATQGCKFKLDGASIGKLVVRNGQGFLISADDDGNRCEVAIAEFLAESADGEREYDYSWQLVGEEEANGERPTLWVGNWRYSWLNAWGAPWSQYGEDDADERIVMKF